MSGKKPAPPQFTSERPYADWVRRVEWWKAQTDLDAGKQGVALASSLDGRALDAVLELKDAEINSDTGVDEIIKKLDKIFKKNTLTEKIEDIEKFENHLRSEHVSIKDYITTFDKYTNKLRVHKIEYPDDIKGYKLLKGANLQPNEEKLIRATIGEIGYDHVLKKLKDIYGDEKAVKTVNFKTEDTLYANSEEQSDEDRCDEFYGQEGEEACDTYYTTRYRRGNFRQQGMRPESQTYNRRPSESIQKFKPRQPSSTPRNWRNPGPILPTTSGRSSRSPNRAQGRNPPTRSGAPSTCGICNSINHWARDCPDREINEVSLVVDGVVLHANNESALKSLVSETWGSLVLDCGASSTVCGQTWFDEFQASLNETDRAKITYATSSKPFRFGDGNIVRSTTKAAIPAYIGQKDVVIKTEIVDADIPLLFSNSALKKGNMGVNFGEDSITAFGQKLPLKVTSNGLYSLPITRPVQLLNNMTDEQQEKSSIVLALNEEKSDRDVAKKLHRCFAHPSAERLHRLLDGAGDKWSQNENLRQEINTVTKNCDVCKVYKKPPSRPVVALPQSSEFQELVAMDLKQYQGRQILHLIDSCTRLSAATFIPNKKQETVVAAILRIWVAVYGSPKKILTDNGGEFANAEFIQFCEQFGITIQTTAAESPWSNGIVERANQTVARSMDKIIFDTGCDPDLALLWSLNAKNALQNVAGFSPFQLVLGRNPNLPSVITDDTPALTRGNMSGMMRDNLNVIHAARTAFIACENDEKIRRALKANVRSSGEIKYVTGDQVTYKRDTSSEWHGPGIVIGQTGQQVFIKHGSFYIRVHPCRLQLVKEATRTTTDTQIGVPEKTTMPTNSIGPDLEHNEATQEQMSGGTTQSSPQADITHQSVSETPRVNPATEESPPRVSPTTEESPPSVDTTQQILTDTPEVEIAAAGNAPSNGKSSAPPSNLVQKGMIISHTDFEGQPSQHCTIVSRGGRATGKNKNWWNTVRSDGSQHAVNLDAVHKWHIVTENNAQHTGRDNMQENIMDEALLASSKVREHEAKLAELDQWKTMGVYEEVEDTGQQFISLRWVVKDKMDEQGNTVCKARLCARGFEEEQDFRTDSPTCSREGIRLFLATAAAHRWKIHSMDVKGAFLQGKELDREVLIRPPKEAACSNLWLLKKCAYGLADAPRRWYLRIREALAELEATASQYDNGVFMFIQSGILQGMAILHVDDILWAGNQDYMKPIVTKIKSIFEISHESEDNFTYVGLHTVQDSDGSITIDQLSYIDSMSTIPLSTERLKAPHQALNTEETSDLRTALGQLNWVANMTRPDISFTVSRISARVKQATVTDIKDANKMIKHVKETPSSVLFPVLDIPTTRVVAFTDSSFNNIDDGGSQGGQLVLLKDKFNNSCPISWRSTRVRRIARSTLAAETLAFADGMDTAAFVSHLACELQMCHPETMIQGITDSRSLVDAASTSTLITDRRLRVEISAIREMKERGEVDIEWTPNEHQLADVLTKKGASSKKLLECIKLGKLQLGGAGLE